MNDNPNTFERLVLTLESTQRQDMLRQLAEKNSQQENAIEPARRIDGGLPEERFFPDKKLLEEPFPVRLWFTIIAFFSSSSPTRLYSESLVSRLGKKLALSYGRLIDAKNGLYTAELHQELLKLRKIQGFFSALLTAYENDKGAFYIILGSMYMPITCSQILKTTDPFSVPYDRELHKDVRQSFLREMETIFAAIPEQERSPMYQAVQSIEWIRNFAAMPVERMLFRFNAVSGVKPSCNIDSIEDEMKVLAQVLAGGKKIPILLLESLYLFTVQNEMLSEKFDMERECETFVSTASINLSGIRQFKTSVPVSDFVRFSMHDVAWQPTVTERGEDWFLLFKNAWKKRFDEKWADWNRLHRKAMLEKNSCLFLGVDSIPPLRNRPWEGLWLPLSLRREFSVIFLNVMFSTIYPLDMMKPLKILLLDGDFYRRENLVEYTDAFSTLEHMHQLLETFENRLSPKGDLGEGFVLLHAENGASVKGKARLENLMLNLDFEAEVIIGRAMTAFRSMDAILGGVVGVVRGGAYETLINMASIQGKFNERYRKELESVRSQIQGAAGYLSDAEVIEKEFL